MSKVALVLILIVSFFTAGHAGYQVNPNIEKIFNRFIIKVEQKLTKEKELIFLKSLNQKIISIGEKKNLSKNKEKIFKDLLVLSNEKIFDLENEKALENNSQKILESSIRGNLKSSLSKIETPSFLEKINTQNIEILKIGEKLEFIENNKIKRAGFTKYFNINSGNVRSFQGKKGTIVIKKSGETWFVENLTKVEKIPYSKAYNYVKSFAVKNKKYIEENGVFYSYQFKNFTYLEDKYGFYISDLEANNIDVKETVLFLSENKRYNFVLDFKKVKLINSDILYGVTDKQKFLEHLVNDKLYLYDDTDSLFKELQIEINELTDGLTQEEKIKKIYSWVLSGVSYTKDLDIQDKKIFSGILTYKNSDGVCEGYVKLNSYALMFAGVPETDVIRGDVIDAQDFPKIGHAWMKIGDKYYDPTFDDPIGLEVTKTEDEFKYFGLPRDLLYANRFDYGVTPEALKTKTMEFRTNFINQRLSKLSDKYRSSNYLVLKGVDFRKEHGLNVGDNIDLDSVKKILPYYEVIEKASGEIIFYKSGVKKNITKLQYFIVNDTTINQVFEQKNYNIDGLYLFKWNFANGKTEYRIGFEVEIR